MGEKSEWKKKGDRKGEIRGPSTSIQIPFTEKLYVGGNVYEFKKRIIFAFIHFCIV